MAVWRTGFFHCCVITTLFGILMGLYGHLHGIPVSWRQYLPPTSTQADSQSGTHPINRLITLATVSQERLLSQRTSTLPNAASTYRSQRGRHPPPGFDAWVQYALDNNVLIIESLFDQIYHDLEPFWSIPPSRIRHLASTWHQIISVRNRTATMRAPRLDMIQWLPLWHTALSEIAHLLPDVDMAFNDIDEPRVIVPWEDITAAVQVAARTKLTSLSSARIGAGFPSYEPLPPIDPASPPNGRPWRDDKPYWHHVRNACHPDSEARVASFSRSVLSLPPVFNTMTYPAHTLQGFVTNATLSRSPCSNPELRYLHGALIAPAVQSTSTSLFPLFGGCKISGVNNEILVPAAYYFSHDAQFDGGQDEASQRLNNTSREIPWHEKKQVAFWRGAATGGVHTAENWRHFQRHRFVAMLNASQLSAAARSDTDTDAEESTEASSQWTHNFALPNTTLYPLSHIISPLGPRGLSSYTSSHADAAFTHQMCFPQHLSLFGPGKECAYSSPFFATAPAIPLPDFVTAYRVLPDVDGQSYSGRFRAYMRRSGALVVKGSVFDDWTLVGGRLGAWTHYVPMTAAMGEWWALMDYFLPGDVSGRAAKSRDQAEQRQEQARQIAKDGRAWAAKVLRREDMLAYMYRLVLEYARLCAEERDRMGWADDLL